MLWDGIATRLADRVPGFWGGHASQTGFQFRLLCNLLYMLDIIYYYFHTLTLSKELLAQEILSCFSHFEFTTLPVVGLHNPYSSYRIGVYDPTVNYQENDFICADKPLANVKTIYWMIEHV